MAVEGTVLEFASLTYGHVWVSDEITFAAGPANIDHDLGVQPDFVVAICLDNQDAGIDLTCVVESGNEANGITLTNAGGATATGVILAFFSSRGSVTSPTSGNVYELASRSIAQVYISDEKACANGATTFDHETGRDLLFAIPICVDSADGDFDLSIAETNTSRLTVTQGAATTVGVQVLAFFGPPGSAALAGNSVEGTVIDIASLTLGYIFSSDESVDIASGNEDLDHEIVRVPKMGVPIVQETGGGGSDDFDLSISLATLTTKITDAAADTCKAKALVFFGTP
ncbi:hypothetical protein LCGC14_1868030 [marine sediment metagenome]|uniref:Uncharacterized protein n=1 Tax=marine sediment metagenome TaxID=412755 RepID=A0A0F9G5Q4_9ZZZZ